MLLINTPLGFLSIGQGERKNHEACLLQAHVGCLALLLVTCHQCSSLSLPKGAKPQQMMLHLSAGSSTAAQPRARRKVMWIKE